LSVRKNITANFLGGAFGSVLGFLLVPVYLHYIGREGYGLIGFFTLLSGVAGLLDAGLSVAMGRELAAMSATDDVQARSDSRDLVRTMEWLFWLGSLVVGTLMVLGAPFFAKHWLKVETLGIDEATWALRLMGAGFVLQWPTSLYSGCLVALQRQVRLNVITAVMGVVRGGGAVAVLGLVSPTVTAFFVWQLVSLAVMVIVLYVGMWTSLPANGPMRRPRFSTVLLRRMRRFAAGVGAIQVLSVALTSLDKVILSKLLSLAEFGTYSLAWTIASQLARITGPIFHAVYPRLVQCVTSKDDATLRSVFRRAYQLVSVALVPFALVLVGFSEHVLYVWTWKAEVAAQARWPMALLTLGCMLNGLVALPYALTLAFGQTGLVIRANTVAVVALAPLTWVLASRFGLVGAAFSWPLLNAAYVAFLASRMIGPLVPGETWAWFKSSILVPGCACALVFVPVSYLVPIPGAGERVTIVATVALGYALATALTALALPAGREELVRILRRARWVRGTGI
jgi:O-antigen/teichoic acid export membrane protein